MTSVLPFRCPVLIFLMVLLWLVPCESKATHLIGGNVGYEDLGPDPNNSNNRKYRIYIRAYMDCNSNIWGSVFPEPSVNVGIYKGVLFPPAPISLEQELTLTLQDSGYVDPNVPDHCSGVLNFLTNACTYLVDYSAVVSLPASAIGYWVVYERCCRTGNILNLLNAGNQGFSYIAWISSQSGSLFQNSSPTFNDTLVSYICKGDTGYLSNSATDPDGDSLVYSLEIPFKGVLGNGSGGNPPPISPYTATVLNPYTINPPQVLWAAGFSGAQIFGAGGYQYIDPNTGITQFSSQTPGFFVAAVEIKEYRNGVQIGVIRRNIQLIVEDCPANNAPYHDVSSLSAGALTPLSYEYEAGQNFCFDLKYKDPDNDSLKVKASGAVFNNAFTVPTATISHPTVQDDSITATFCWNTGCGQGRFSPPYTFNVTVSDVACPPLPLVQQVKVFVKPFVGPIAIKGDTLACSNQGPFVYSVDSVSGASYDWSVTGGTIISGNNSPSIEVNWGNTSTGEVELETTSQYGCKSAKIKLPVKMSFVPVDAGSPAISCPGDTVQIGGSPTTNAGYTVNWFPNTNITSSTAFNPGVFPDTTTDYILEVTDTLGCKNKDTVRVKMHPYTPSDLLDDYFVCAGDSVQITTKTGTDHQWMPATGLSNPNVPNPFFYGPLSRDYTLSYKDANGCRWKDTIHVAIGAKVPTDAGPAKAICKGDSVQIGGSPTGPPFTEYSWSHGPTVKNQNAANPIVYPSVTTIYTVTTMSDTCRGTDTVTVVVWPDPLLRVNKDVTLCAGDTFQLKATGNGVFEWNSILSLTGRTGARPKVFPKVNTVYTVTLTDPHGCTRTDSVKVKVAPYPVADAGGTIYGCENTPIRVGGNPTGASVNTFTWVPAAQLDDSTRANPTFTSGTSEQLVVFVKNADGCVSKDTAQIYIRICDCYVYIPNAFTPDEDGLNDGFSPKFYCDFEYFDFSIFDRWGEMVFTTTKEGVDWDGTYEGEPAQQGVYVYRLIYKSKYGEEKERFGQVTLIAK